MNRRHRLTTRISLSFLLLLPVSAAWAADFLTEPSPATPVDIALGYLESNRSEMGLAAGDLVDLVISDQYVSSTSGVTHIYLQQRLGGIEVVNGLINISVMPDGRILKVGSRFVAGLADKVTSRSPAIQPETALARAAQHLKIEVTESPTVLENRGGPAMEVLFSGAGISHDAIPAKLVYFPRQDGKPVLAWSLLINQLTTPDWWVLFVDAQTGEIAGQFNLTEDTDEVARAKQAAMQSRSQARAQNSSPQGASDKYRVFALPKESPLNGGRTLEETPWDTTASPFGWHDTDGSAGAEFNDSRGNNVDAHTDRDANNSVIPPDIRADGGPNRIFDFPLDLGTEQPVEYQEAAVTNLFYWNNVLHDISYSYGFDEAAGNFQVNNYGNGGVAGDAVQADAQDGSGCNNANFGTPSDGGAPRMQMFEWFAVPNGAVTVNSPPGIADSYDAARGCWGGELDPSTTEDLELAEDGTGNNEGCNSFIGFTSGKIALVDRGSCDFSEKAFNAQNAGAVGTVVVNNQQLPNGIISMGAGGEADSITIPAVMIGNADGQTIKDEMAVETTVNATLEEVAGTVNRDSDLDNGIIAHEYGHGISNRLVGGPGSVFCLNGNEQMGEGWSDWWTLTLSALPADTGEQARGIGNYSTFLEIDGPGIRNFPYSTDMAVNPQTYADIASTNIPHGVGEIWNAMLWELYWELVERDGFDTNLYAGTGGNNLAIQLVVEGMKLTTCNPTFVDARDAILAADVALNGSANDCEIWRAFAKRGVGVGASGGSPSAVGDETESFVFPEGCEVVEIFSDGFESGNTDAW